MADAAPPRDAEVADVFQDAGLSDAPTVDATPADSGLDAAQPDVQLPDSAFPDAQSADADPGLDAEATDSGPGLDAEVPDVFAPDAEVPDASAADASLPDATGPDSGTFFPPTAEWSWGPIRPSQDRAMGAAVWTGHEMMITGGRGGGPAACSGDTLLYAPALDQWRSLGVNHNQSVFSFVWAGERGYALGGFSCGLKFTVTNRGTAIHPGGLASPGVPRMPGARSGHSGIWTGTEILLWGGDDAGASCDEACATTTERGVRYDPLSNSWSIINLVGAPLDGFAVWTRELMFVWGAGGGGLYDPALDAWLPVSAPRWAPDGSRRAMVWTGLEVFVYGPNGTSALYDPALDSWRPASSSGAPSPNFPRSFWTGTEVLVIGDNGGGHYDPVGDAWRGMPTQEAYFPLNHANVTWTGSELLSFAGEWTAGSSPGQGAKYGPRIIEDPSCVNSSADLSVRISQPTTRIVVSAPFTVNAVLTNAYAIQSADWILDGTSLGALGVTTGTIDPSALPRGTYNLQVRVEDILGNTACHDRTLFVDAPPTVTIESPLPWRTAAGSIQARATCQDAAPEGCTLRFLENGIPRAQSAHGAGVLEVNVNVSGRDGQEVELRFEAIDHRAQRTQASVTNVVVESPGLTLHASPGGEICDVALDRVLFRRADDVLVAHALPSAVDTAMPVTGANLNCSKSSLVPGGALIITQNRAHHWNAGAMSTWVSADTRAAGNLATTATGGTITLRDLVQGTSEVVTSAYGSPVHALAANGAVVYRDSSDDFFRFLPGQGSTLVGRVPGPTQQYPVTNGDGIVLRQRISGPDYTLLRWDGVALGTLVPTTNLWSNAGPLPVDDYAMNGSFIAYAAPDLLGTYLLWRRDGAGASQIVTPRGGATEMRGLLDDGRIIYEAGGRLMLWSPSASTRDVGPASARVWVRGSEIFLSFGYDVYRVTP